MPKSPKRDEHDVRAEEASGGRSQSKAATTEQESPAEMKSELHRLHSVMAAVPDFVYHFDLEGRFTYVTQSLLDLWQKTHEEAIGKNFHELDYPPELATKLQRQIQEVIETRQALKDETPYTSASRARMYEYIFFPVVAENNRVDGVAGVTRDITNRKTIEQALRESEARFRAMFEQASVGIVQIRDDGSFGAANPGFCQFIGYGEEELKQMRVRDVTHSDDYPREEELTKQLAAGTLGEYTLEKRYVRKSGAIAWGTMTATFVRHASGEPLYTLAIVQAINDDLKQAQAKTGEVEERFRLLVEGTPDYAMFLLDRENRITFWSSGAEKVFGWSAEEAVGESGDIIFIAEDKAKGAVETELTTAIAQGYAPDRRWHRRKDGSRFWADGIMRRVDHADGRIRGFAKICRDAMDHWLAQEELRRAHDELEQRVNDRTKELQAMNETLEQEMERRQRLESEILQVTERERANISQDLHDSLCQELTATAFLLKSKARALGRTDPEAGEALTEGAEMVNRNAGLARDLARGLHPLELGTGGLVSALRELASRTSQTVTCKCECPRSLRVPNEAVAVNLYRIAQEAVTNSLKHAKPTEVVICIERLHDEIHLVIVDNGTPKRGRKGGLGTQMMQYRASVSGGTLEISSKKDKGTKVSCRVPAKG